MTPILETERLLLRPLAEEDASAIQVIAGDRQIADTTISIPHPLDIDGTRQWITAKLKEVEAGHARHWVMVARQTQEMVGSILLRDIDNEHHLAELGFWIGRNWWGKGYTTEALRRVVRFGFTDLDMNRLYAFHMVRNPASGAVLAKAGFQQEGIMRQRVCKWGKFEDVVVQAVILDDWREIEPQQRAF